MYFKALVVLICISTLAVVILNFRMHSTPVIDGFRERYSVENQSSSRKFFNDPSTFNFAFEAMQDENSVLRRIHSFNTAFEIVRQKEIHTLNNTEWTAIDAVGKIHLIHGGDDNYFDILSKFSQVRTATIPWFFNEKSKETWSSLNDSSNLLVQKYYDWVAADPLCTWIETPGLIRRAYVITCNRTCYRNPKLTHAPIAVPVVSLYAVTIKGENNRLDEGKVLPEQFYRQPPEVLSYTQVIRHGLITNTGEVYSKDIKIVPFGCIPNTNIDPPKETNSIPLHSEVYVISQYWGAGVFHRMVEVIPRISIHLEFLYRNRHILIHSPTNQGIFVELLELLGIGRDRLVTGMIRARVVYLPRATLCGYANALEIQLLSKRYRDYIKTNLRNEKRDKIVLIRRSNKRRFSEQSAIEGVVKSAADSYGLSYSIFPDNPTPSLKEAMLMFQSAVMVIGPHGAGLSNIVFSEPGTIVIEGVCNRPHVNLCFLRTAFILGHRWHGLPSRGGCEGVVDVSASFINDTIIQYLESITN